MTSRKSLISSKMSFRLEKYLQEIKILFVVMNFSFDGKEMRIVYFDLKIREKRLIRCLFRCFP
jgi:hypothetical protein